MGNVNENIVDFAPKLLRDILENLVRDEVGEDKLKGTGLWASFRFAKRGVVMDPIWASVETVHSFATGSSSSCALISRVFYVDDQDCLNLAIALYKILFDKLFYRFHLLAPRDFHDKCWLYDSVVA